MEDCGKLTDAGLAPLVDQKIKMTELNLFNCNQITKTIAAKIIGNNRGSYGTMVLPEKLQEELSNLDIDPNKGKLKLFVDALPDAEECDIPHMPTDEVVKDMVLLALNKLPNLKKGHLHLNSQQKPENVNLEHIMTMNPDRHRVLLSIQAYQNNATKLNVCNSNFSLILSDLDERRTAEMDEAERTQPFG